MRRLIGSGDADMNLNETMTGTCSGNKFCTKEHDQGTILWHTYGIFIRKESDGIFSVAAHF